jgi:predicted MFS family arabinose efflux permease
MRRVHSGYSGWWTPVAACLAVFAVSGLAFWAWSSTNPRGRRTTPHAGRVPPPTPVVQTPAVAEPAVERASRYPGWLVPVGACLALGIVSGLGFWAFGLFVDPLEAEFGWSKSILAGAVSVSMLASGLASPLVGRLVDRFQPRRIILIGTAASVFGYALMTAVQELWQFLVLTALLAFFRAFIFYVPFTTIITRWFSRSRATAMGIATSGFGIGGLIFLPLTSELLALLGWRATFGVIAVLVLVVIGGFAAFVRNDPPAAWTALQAAPAPVLGVAPDEGICRFKTLHQIYRAPVFWLMALGFSMFYFGQWSFLFHGPQVLHDAGLSTREAAMAMAATGGLGVIVRLSTGALLARFMRIEVLAVGVLAIMAAALGILTTGIGTVGLLLFVLFWGVGSGLGPALEPLFVSRYFDRRHYASVYGALDGIETAVSFPGPWLGGLGYDLGQSYVPALALYGGALAVGAVTFGFLPRALRRQQTVSSGVQAETVTRQVSPSRTAPRLSTSAA